MRGITKTNLKILFLLVYNEDAESVELFGTNITKTMPSGKNYVTKPEPVVVEEKALVITPSKRRQITEALMNLDLWFTALIKIFI